MAERHVVESIYVRRRSRPSTGSSSALTSSRVRGGSLRPKLCPSRTSGRTPAGLIFGRSWAQRQMATSRPDVRDSKSSTAGASRPHGRVTTRAPLTRGARGGQKAWFKEEYSARIEPIARPRRHRASPRVRARASPAHLSGRQGPSKPSPQAARSADRLERTVGRISRAPLRDYHGHRTIRRCCSC